MGERKGQNKYYPPDYDPKAGGLNKFLGTHALRERARKIHLGIIIIRFEMPYNIWCEGCKNHIGMGVRYNAEKTKVGMYYSTPVYEFRMKCHLCDNYFVIKTDPGNLDYEIVSGARRQEKRWDPTDNEQVVADTKEVQRKLFDDPMYKLEHVAGDLRKSEDAKPRLGRLYARNQNVWDDDYTANCRLRSEFRYRKKELKLEEDRDKALLAKSSLDIELLPESDQDARLAAMMRLQSAKSVAEREHEKLNALINKPALPSATITAFSGLRSERLLNAKLNQKALGIVKKEKRKVATCTTSDKEAMKKSKFESDVQELKAVANEDDRIEAEDESLDSHLQSGSPTSSTADIAYSNSSFHSHNSSNLSSYKDKSVCLNTTSPKRSNQSLISQSSDSINATRSSLSLVGYYDSSSNSSSCDD